MPYELQETMQESTSTAQCESTSSLVQEAYSALSVKDGQSQRYAEQLSSAAASSAMQEFGALELVDSGCHGGGHHTMENAKYNSHTDTASYGGDQIMENAKYNSQTDTVSFAGSETSVDFTELSVDW